eukprot:9273522-Pyramimonas_sp.AAC.1
MLHAAPAVSLGYRPTQTAHQRAGVVPVGAVLGQVEVLEGGGGQLRVPHPSVASHAAARDARRVHLDQAENEKQTTNEHQMNNK